jgi:anti-anti-sigma factor
MIPTAFSTSTRRPTPGVVEIEINGVLDGQAEQALNRAYDRTVGQVYSTLLLNFAGLTGIDAAGAGALVLLLTRAQRNKRRVLGCGLKDEHRQIFELTKLAEAMALYPSEADALAELRPSATDHGRAGLGQVQ